MRNLWVYFEVFLILGGMVVALVGLVWSKTSSLARQLGGNGGTDKGFWVMLIGCAMFGLGWLLG